MTINRMSIAVPNPTCDDLEEARENPRTTAWGYVDKTAYHCRRCRNEWSVAGENRPYRP